MLKYLGVRLAAVLVVGLALWPLTVTAAPAWENWQTVAGVFDVGGPRSDGSLLVAGSGALYTLAPDGTLSPFARAVYRDDPGAEAYVTVSPGLKVGDAGCSFPTDRTYILRLHAAVGVTWVNADGSAGASLADAGLPSLNGIAFDTTGSFGHRLLVTAPVAGKTEVEAIDCNGGVQVVTTSAPTAEGGIAVAPQSFGAFAGDLIAPDELSGLIWAIAPDGGARQVVNSGLPKGGDIGVESVAFVPVGFTARGGYVYYSDRSTAGNPHPGTDHVLRLSSGDLAAAGVQDGDLLAATEGGASMIDVRCAATCAVTTVVATPTTAHGEGHLAFTMNPAPPASPPAQKTPPAIGVPNKGPTTNWAPITALAFLIAAIAVVGLLVRRTNR